MKLLGSMCEMSSPTQELPEGAEFEWMVTGSESGWSCTMKLNKLNLRQRWRMRRMYAVASARGMRLG